MRVHRAIALTVLATAAFGCRLGPDCRPQIDRAYYFAQRARISNKRLSSTIRRNNNVLFDYWDDHPELMELDWLAYVLGTQWLETGFRERPVNECGLDEEDAVVRCLDRWYAKKIRREREQQTRYWDPEENGQRYFGRGFVQLTLAANYRDMGERLGVPLYDHPELANDAEISAEIIFVGMVEGRFRKSHSLRRYFDEGVDKAQWEQAWAIVHGSRRDSRDIAARARRYRSALRYLDNDALSQQCREQRALAQIERVERGRITPAWRRSRPAEVSPDDEVASGVGTPDASDDNPEAFEADPEATGIATPNADDPEPQDRPDQAPDKPKPKPKKNVLRRLWDWATGDDQDEENR